MLTQRLRGAQPWINPTQNPGCSICHSLRPKSLIPQQTQTRLASVWMWNTDDTVFTAGKFKIPAFCLHHKLQTCPRLGVNMQKSESSKDKNYFFSLPHPAVLRHERMSELGFVGLVFPPGRPAYLVGVAGLEHVTGHLGLRVVRLAPQQIREIRQVVAVVDEARDELSFVLKNKNRGVGAAGGDAADEGGVEDQLDLPRLHQGPAVALLAPPADLGHQPRQHGQSGPPVQRGPADVSQGEPAVVLLHQALHVDPADFRRCGG